MDRLQVAIEKARAQRAEALENRPDPAVGVPPPPETETPAGSEAAPDAAPGPAPVDETAAAQARTEEAAAPVLAPASGPAAAGPGKPAAPGGTGRLPAERTSEPAPGLWENLLPVNTHVRQLRNNRLLTVRGGSGSVPFDLLRTRVLHQARQNGWRRIGIISPTARCGKTTAAANLAFAFSRQPELRIVMLDLDLRRPQLMKMLGQKVETSMEEVLRGKVPFAEHARVLGSNVALGFSTGQATDPSELLQSDETARVLARIDADFAPDLTLMDLPPMMATDDNFGFLSRVDAVLVLAAAEQTTMEQIEVTLRQLGDLTAVMGIVLNKCHHVRGAYGYDNNYYQS